MEQAKDKKKKTIVISIAVLCIIFSAIFLFFALKKEKTPEPVEVLMGDYYFFPDQTNLFTLFDGDVAEIRLIYGYDKAKIYENEDKTRYLNSPDKQITYSMPIFQRNGATITLSEQTLRHRFLTTSLALVSNEGTTFVTLGDAFREDNEKLVKDPIFLIDFGHNIYMNPSSFVLYDRVKTEIPSNSILLFEDNQIKTFLYDGGIYRRTDIRLTKQALLAIGEEKYIYMDFYDFLNQSEKSEMPKLSDGRTVLEGNYTYWFLGSKYTIEGPGILYRTEEGLFYENANYSFLLPSCMLYREDGTVFLPVPYMAMDITHKTFVSTPRGTVLQKNYDITFASYKDVTTSFVGTLLHDGSEHFLVTEDSVLKVGEEEFALPALSSVYIEEELKIGAYNYQTGEYKSFAIGGLRPDLILYTGDALRVKNRTIYHTDGSITLLMPDPTVFPEMK